MNTKKITAEEKQACISIIKETFPYYGCVEDEDIDRLLADNTLDAAIMCMKKYSDIVSSPLKAKIEELEKELEFAKLNYVEFLRRNELFKTKNEELESSANKLAEAAEKLQAWNKEYPASRVYSYDRCKEIANELESIVKLQVEALTTFRGINKKDNGE